MKKLLLAAVLSLACVTSAFSVGLGIRADADFGFGKNPNATAEEQIRKMNKPALGYSFGAWLDLPFINLKIITVGIRPEIDYSIGSGMRIINESLGLDEQTYVSSFDIPVFLTANFDLSILKVGAGGGAYVSFPTTGRYKSNGLVSSIDVAKGPLWGFCAFANAGFRVGPGFLLIDGRLITSKQPFAKEITVSGEKIKNEIFKRSDIEIGVAYEFVFK